MKEGQLKRTYWLNNHVASSNEFSRLEIWKLMSTAHSMKEYDRMLVLLAIPHFFFKLMSEIFFLKYHSTVKQKGIVSCVDY